MLSLSRCLHYCCTYPLCNTAVFDERMDSAEVSFRCQNVVCYMFTPKVSNDNDHIPRAAAVTCLTAGLWMTSSVSSPPTLTSPQLSWTLTGTSLTSWPRITVRSVSEKQGASLQHQDADCRVTAARLRASGVGDRGPVTGKLQNIHICHEMTCLSQSLKQPVRKL